MASTVASGCPVHSEFDPLSPRYLPDLRLLPFPRCGGERAQRSKRRADDGYEAAGTTAAKAAGGAEVGMRPSTAPLEGSSTSTAPSCA
jgi:hypothetical protein